MVAFHAGFGWARGGYLGVSTFFTLSGFLITCLLLEEHARTGRIDLRHFWARRFRRLLPAALGTLVVIAAAAVVLATPEQLVGLRGDVMAALFDIANWRFLLARGTYGDLFASPSPVLHFWSLAIEEQFYLVYPVVVFAVFTVARRVRRLLVALLVAFTVAAVGIGVAWPGYYSTVVRAPELLVGGLLAVALGRRRRLDAGRASVAVSVAGPIALVGIVAAWSSVAVDSAVLYRGGFLVHAIATAVVIVVAMQPGPVRAALSLAPLRWLGRVSYGVYLFHWPIFVWLTPERIGLAGQPLIAAQVALTLGLAALSSRLVEQPIRAGRLARSWRAPALGLAVATLVCVLAVAATIDQPVRRSQFANPRLDSSLIAQTAAPTPAIDGSIPRVDVFGDSTALRTAYGLPGWGMRTAELSVMVDQTRLGCALGRGGVIDTFGRPRSSSAECNDWPQRWRAAIEERRPDAAMIQIGPWDVSDRKLPGQRAFSHIGQPAYDAFLEGEMRLAVDVLSSSGARVLWLTSPEIDLQRGMVPRPSTPLPTSDPARMTRLNQLIREVAAERPDTVRVIDVAAHLRAVSGGGPDTGIRPDGVHLSEEASIELASWLGPRVLDELSVPDRRIPAPTQP